MKLYRFVHENEVRYGKQSGETLTVISSDDLFTSSNRRKRSRTVEIPFARVTLLTPVRPGKIVGVGRNYADHAKELGNAPPSEPIIFLKPPSALLDPFGTIKLPPVAERVDFEGELAIVVGRRAQRISAANWRDYVLGFSCANDVTARDLQKKDVQFTRAKSFDTFCPLGPAIETELDVKDLQITTRLDGEVRQSGRTSQMVFPPDVLLEFITSIMTLEPGDVILTGTPAGVGPLSDGNVVEVEIEGIGVLQNRVSSATV